MKHITKNFKQTQRLGEKLAKKIIENRLQPATAKNVSGVNIKAKTQALILGLYGDLGSGKTTFLQGFARGLKIKEKILSPTFVILKHFKITNSDFTDFYHIDCYRLKNKKEILEMGFKKIISNPKNIVAIEWPDKIYPQKRGQKKLPDNFVRINFKFIDDGLQREISF